MEELEERLVEMGGRLLFLRTAGTGRPMVVVDSGLGDTADEWLHIQSAVAMCTRVCTYDRAGLGRSDPATGPRTSASMVDDLHALLRAAHESGPYVLVGHSLGGLNAQLYASRYPEEVAGLVLVEAAHGEFEAMLARALPEEWKGQQGIWAGENEEGVNFFASYAQVRTARWRLDVPVVVLMAGRMPPEEQPANWSEDKAAAYFPAWRELQEDLARRSVRGRLVVAERSGHNVQRFQPELIVAAIGEVVAAVYEGPLGGGGEREYG